MRDLTKEESRRYYENLKKRSVVIEQLTLTPPLNQSSERMSKATKATNFIHSYKGYMLIGGFVLIFSGYILDYFAPRPNAKVDTDFIKGMFPTMSIIGAGVLLIPYIAVYLIQTIASKIGKNTPPPQG
jgi:hypothetical protein